MLPACSQHQLLPHQRLAALIPQTTRTKLLWPTFERLFDRRTESPSCKIDEAITAAIASPMRHEPQPAAIFRQESRGAECLSTDLGAAKMQVPDAYVISRSTTMRCSLTNQKSRRAQVSLCFVAIAGCRAHPKPGHERQTAKPDRSSYENSADKLDAADTKSVADRQTASA